MKQYKKEGRQRERLSFLADLFEYERILAVWPTSIRRTTVQR